MLWNLLFASGLKKASFSTFEPLAFLENMKWHRLVGLGDFEDSFTEVWGCICCCPGRSFGREMAAAVYGTVLVVCTFHGGFTWVSW